VANFAIRFAPAAPSAAGVVVEQPPMRTAAEAREFWAYGFGID
jgi:hypothetical protein